ncbi:hypothetical protein AAZX31_02G000800 [Glycine max]|uniref:Sieve element occlusion N-terminal domain-containing protein n=1 Tax=Glycine soja TaxID=3848 RepID=A0A445LHJ7_GLYSO|nr:hypothetical protein GLYMA_02G000751v4 [Glycine max]KAG4401492.1 hypothetical protein GLYMA_02G000751v4 [Glycine max]KAH1058036.1 hypothetical protein GYH30_002553 [Glycine max]KAH1058037.1 hypothetical protein GYH30_002553 [Glycine max]RZC22710.1 hypothetical protein D0Y65_002537 [Glycine soja]
MSNSNTQPKPLLPNPFNLSDTEIVEKVYVLSHTYDDQVFDNEPLFNVVSNVIKLSTQIVGALHKIDEPNGFIGNPISTTSFKPEFSTLKLMSCQMMTLPWGPENAHQTTLGILQQLRDYSWDAKVLIAIAALALEYGNFWNLQQVSEPQGNSLRLLNQIQHRQILVTNINTTVKLVMADGGEPCILLKPRRLRMFPLSQMPCSSSPSLFTVCRLQHQHPACFELCIIGLPCQTFSRSG